MCVVVFVCVVRDLKVFVCVVCDLLCDIVWHVLGVSSCVCVCLCVVVSVCVVCDLWCGVVWLNFTCCKLLDGRV